MGAKVQKGMGGGGGRGEPCHVSYTDIQILLFNSLSKIRFEYLKCKASELISKQYRISY